MERTLTTFAPRVSASACPGHLSRVGSEEWYRNAIVYSASVETFMDGNGDGVGDFVGLRDRLDYLESLGVDVLWLAPTQPTPNRDDGYDIADYYGIDPRFGSSGDFVEFVQEAEARGIRVLIDLVVNHTSDRHPWFLDARSSPRSRYRDWYVWSKRRPPHIEKGVVFPGVQKTTWSFARDAGAWYFHRFYDFQPDLNTANPRVREEIGRIVTYWLQLGAAGFRVDAVPFLLEKPVDGKPARRPHFEYLRELRDTVQWKRGDGVLLGEANVTPRDDDEYFANGDGLHMMFNFWVNQRLFLSLARGEARPLAEALRATSKVPAGAQWAHFLRNHDELDLGRLTDTEREEVFARFAPEPAMRLYDRGIRRRLAPMLGDRARLELAYSLLFSLPGAPVLRYGEELGMGENLRLKERNAIRTPMQWSPEHAGGFSSSGELVRPAIAAGRYSYREVNVQSELRDPASLLRWLIELIRVRKRCPEIGAGEWRVLALRNRHVLGLVYEREPSSAVVCVHNLDERPQVVTLPLDAPRLVSLLDGRDLTGPRPEAQLDPFGYRWYRAPTD
jgi:maltose alpha-D-glucosyltransferase / alpha-amylase